VDHDSTPVLNTVVWVAALLDSLVGIAVLFSRRGGTPGWSKPAVVSLARLTVAMAVGVAVFAARLPFLVGAGANVFGLLHAAYADLVLSLPLGGLAVLLGEQIPHPVRPFVRLTRATRFAAIVMCLPGLVGIYASYVEPYRLQLETAQVALAPERPGTEPLRVAVLADIQTDHVTDYEFSAIRRIMEQSPDIILLPGDLFQSSSKRFAESEPVLRELLGQLAAPGGVYFVQGDVDYPDDIRRVLAGTNVRLLLNETVRTMVRGRAITIGGIETNYRAPGARAIVRALESVPGQDDIRILLAHRPDPVLDLQRDTRIDLMVAGHTHGGQVQIPLIGPIITLSSVPNRVAAGGLHELAGARRVYVSRGVGLERDQAPRLRFLCPPEISLVTLQ
jgi:predicted MPP superfamily phosphohydrolase